MIISIHIPKTAGQSFRLRLEATFKSRALFDYGDWIGVNTPEAAAHDELRKTEMRARREELVQNYDVIHGHFAAHKYIGLFSTTEFVAFFRDPYQRVVSHYHFFLRHPEMCHPAVKKFHEERMDLPQFVAAFPALQSRFLAPIGVEQLAMVGLMEHYEQSIRLFETMFSRQVAPETLRVNVNPARQRETYPIDEVVRKAVSTHCAEDVEVYHRARERFRQLTARRDV